MIPIELISDNIELLLILLGLGGKSIKDLIKGKKKIQKKEYETLISKIQELELNLSYYKNELESEKSSHHLDNQAKDETIKSLEESLFKANQVITKLEQFKNSILEEE